MKNKKIIKHLEYKEKLLNYYLNFVKENENQFQNELSKISINISSLNGNSLLDRSIWIEGVYKIFNPKKRRKFEKLLFIIFYLITYYINNEKFIYSDEIKIKNFNKKCKIITKYSNFYNIGMFNNFSLPFIHYISLIFYYLDDMFTLFNNDIYSYQNYNNNYDNKYIFEIIDNFFIYKKPDRNLRNISLLYQELELQKEKQNGNTSFS